jgi:hypothetical protein
MTGLTPAGAAASWRAACPVLVPDAHAVAMIGVIRSLGRAGYPVHACAETPDALGFGSRYATRHAVCPPIGTPAFLSWMKAYVAEHGIRAIVPTERLLLAIRPEFETLAPLFPVGRDETRLYDGLAKYDQFRQLREGGDAAVARHLPPMVLVASDESLPPLDAFAALPTPLFVKVDKRHGRHDGAGSAVHVAQDAGEARRIVEALRPDYDKLIVQGYVAGRGAAAVFLSWGGRTHAEFMNLCLHETPHTGGYCTLRESWRNEAMLAHARACLRIVGWEGVSMLEYRWDDATGDFHLIEINPRFWASLHVALYAGMDLPRMLLDAFNGHAEDEAPGYRVGVRCRLAVPAEISYVVSCLRDAALPWSRRLWPVAEFFALFLDMRVKADLYFPGDRKLYWREWRRFLRGLGSGRRGAGTTDT